MKYAFILFCLLPTASAHRPESAQLITPIDDPTVSWVINGGFSTGDEVFTIKLDFPRPFALPMELMVEHRAGTEDFRPAYAVVGPGLPAVRPDDAALLPKEVPAGWGAYIAWNDEVDREVYFEQVMRRTMYTTGSFALALREGPNEVWIWSPAGDPGDWQLGLGVEEDFTGGAFADIFAHWGQYAY